MRLTDEEVELFQRIARQEPALRDFFSKQRLYELETLEQGENQISRGRAQAFRDLSKLLAVPTR